MNTITKLVVLGSLCLIFGTAKAQDTIQNLEKTSKIEKFNDAKERVKNEEKKLLKKEIERINERWENGEITQETVNELKLEAAKKHALNIENRITIIDNQKALYERNSYSDSLYQNHDNHYSFSIGGEKFIDFNTPKRQKPPKYDIRTSNELLFAIGFNNTLIDGQSLDDSPYEIGGSGFVELGWIWKTRLLKTSNFARFSYGLSFQWNKLTIKDNLYFVEDGDQTSLQEFPVDLKKSKFRTTSLVVPVHFEFGPSKIKDYGNRIRYFTDDQFKIGVGGFAGVNLSTQQKLKYEEGGDKIKEKKNADFNTSTFVYGLSGYIGVGDFSVYAKYNFNDLFKNQTVSQKNISLGLRWDLD